MVYGLILAAGSGKRMNMKTKKQFYLINDKPVFLYSIDNFLKIKSIDKIYINFDNKDKKNKTIQKFIKDYDKYIKKDKINIIFDGGNERFDSVYNALNAIYNTNNIKRNDNIIIHDSARIIISINDVNKLIKNINKYKSITLGSKSIDTLKSVYDNKTDFMEVKETLDRKNIYNIKTPQGFNFELLYEAYKEFEKDLEDNKTIYITDDLMIIENYTNITPYILETDSSNIKITTKEDLKFIKSFL